MNKTQDLCARCAEDFKWAFRVTAMDGTHKYGVCENCGKRLPVQRYLIGKKARP